MTLLSTLYYLPSFLYGCAVNLRNWLFDVGALKSRSFATPVVSVGNITVGGTGKTPHTEMIVRMMLDEGMRVATLSRGYKRKTKGFRIATLQSTADEVGDEPLQMAIAFPDVTVAVCEDRCHGIARLEEMDNKPDVIILDDAYQHRYVKPLVNILLIDHNRPPYADRLLPAGHLREPFRGKRRADMVIVTKCPAGMSPIEFRVVEQELGLMPFQKLFFTTQQYSDLVPLFSEGGKTIQLKRMLGYDNVLLLTGIAQPEQLRKDLMRYCQRITPMCFADHHAFSIADAESINKRFYQLPADEKIIITTAKDAVRLKQIQDKLSDAVKRSLYVLPVQASFLRNEGLTFKRILMKRVERFYVPKAHKTYL